MEERNLKDWIYNICKEAMKEANELDNPAISFGAGLTMGIICKHLDELERSKNNERFKMGKR